MNKYNIEVYKPKRRANRLNYIMTGIMGGAIALMILKWG